MRIQIMRISIPLSIARMTGDGELIYLYRENERPRLFMRHAVIQQETSSITDDVISFTVSGDLVEGMTFEQLQDGDTLFYTSITRSTYIASCPHFYMDFHAYPDMLLPFECQPTVLGLAAGMEAAPEVYFCTADSSQILTRAQQIHTKASDMYAQNVAYQHIMLRHGDAIEAVSLVQLASRQPKEKQDMLIALFMAFSKNMPTSLTAIATRILEQCSFDESFSLLTQEEQVGMFIEFSKMAATRKREYVSDELIHQISNSPEYIRVKEDLERNGLGLSETQQFNVLQQVGFFSRPPKKEDILYNLSDMGAGKTLMTVEAIFLLDLKRLSSWVNAEAKLTENQPNMEVVDYLVPDKHIIAPTLSVKSSWINTFRLFYDVTEVGDMEYELSFTYQGRVAKSKIYVAPFTVKDGKIFTKEKLPHAETNTYLIIDEIHQLVIRNIPKTKFFPPQTDPSDRYRIFILSGTMSNLKTQQWYYYMRFIGLTISKNTPAAADSEASSKLGRYAVAITDAATNLKIDQHRYFDTEDITTDNTYFYEPESRKTTAVEREFNAKYGSQIVIPRTRPEAGESIPVKDLLTENRNNFYLYGDPVEIDSINFELFYELVGSRAITAQSIQIAEELFGTQKKQHVSDIIKTVSPLSKSDIQILKTLHHIAEDHNQYKSVAIAKAINNAILNLNDGLQTKNIYEILSQFAERNMRFFNYLASLDINVLEQLPKSGLIRMPKLEDTDKFKVLKDILQREPDETYLIVVNDYYALKALSDALGIEHLTKQQLKRELDYQDVLDDLFTKQSIVIVTQDMIKSSLDLVQANRLIQYQLNTEISDIIQTQNRINRIGQTRETRGYYIASDQLQENLIELFLESYRNIRVAHKGIVELFTDITSQINVINDYLEQAFSAMEQTQNDEPEEVSDGEPVSSEASDNDLSYQNPLPENAVIRSDGELVRALLFPQNGDVLVLVPLSTGNVFPLGTLRSERVEELGITRPTQICWNLVTNTVMEGSYAGKY